MSILIRKEHIKSESEMQSLKNAIDENFSYNKFDIKDNLASIAIVSEGLTNDMTRALYLISKSLNEDNIKIEFIIQGASNNSLFLFVDEKDEKLATEKLYSYFM
ncbi:MAG: ACT domain-containing protein [Anaerococcus prevotii]|nr:ACT domain-containing protein [Anaerococcus prevotii]